MSIFNRTAQSINEIKKTGKLPSIVYLGEKECKQLKEYTDSLVKHYNLDFEYSLCPGKFLGLKIIHVIDDSFFKVE